MTPIVRNFISDHRNMLKGRVIEIGSLNVNGGVRDLIDVEVGVDLREGPGVDLVCPVEDLLQHYPPETFDACISTETLEHVKDWQAFVNVTWALVKEGGWLVMTMASPEKRRHAYPDDYWRMDAPRILKIWPNARMVDVAPVSIGWVVQKYGELGDLTQVDPIVVP